MLEVGRATSSIAWAVKALKKKMEAVVRRVGPGLSSRGAGADVASRLVRGCRGCRPSLRRGVVVARL